MKLNSLLYGTRSYLEVHPYTNVNVAGLGPDRKLDFKAYCDAVVGS